MNVYMRGDYQADSFLFTKCKFSELDSLISELKRAGGIYFDGSSRTDISYQYVLDESGAYVEIILGTESMQATS